MRSVVILSPVVIFFFFIITLMAQDDNLFTLTILHFNDFHARFEGVDERTAGACKEEANETCVGGFARLYTLCRKLKLENPNALLLNAGDVFSGSLWYKLFKWNVTSHFMNKLPVDAMTIGNHEFDSSFADIINYLNHSKLPALIANIDSSREPAVTPFILRSIIVDVNGKKVGIIGYVTTNYRVIASVHKLRFKDEVEAINREAKILRSKGVDILIGLSHSGFDVDQQAAKSVDLDIIVGGHSHTFLYTGEQPSTDVPEGDYPTVVKQESGRQVLIVQAGAFSKYLGYLNVTFDEKNSIRSWAGNPILLDNSITEDAAIVAEMEPWKAQVHEIGERVVGESEIFLDSTQWMCRIGECAIGKLITDAMIYEYTKKRQGDNWTEAGIALINAGGIRSSINKGNLTYASLLDVLPFSETYDLIELCGKHILEALEFSVASTKSEFLQFSGIKANIDLNKPRHQRVSDVSVRCSDCPIPQYEPLKPMSLYKVILTSFVAEGGDGYTMIKKQRKRHVKGRVDTDVLQEYLSKFSPLFIELEGNVVVHASPKVFNEIKSLYPKPKTQTD